eukprot:SAG31_NODE_847_length_11532_cov_2.297560_1_plen_204_part_00
MINLVRRRYRGTYRTSRYLNLGALTADGPLRLITHQDVLSASPPSAHAALCARGHSPGPHAQSRWATGSPGSLQWRDGAVASARWTATDARDDPRAAQAAQGGGLTAAAAASVSVSAECPRWNVSSLSTFARRTRIHATTRGCRQGRRQGTSARRRAKPTVMAPAGAQRLTIIPATSAHHGAGALRHRRRQRAAMAAQEEEVS